MGPGTLDEPLGRVRLLHDAWFVERLGAIASGKRSSSSLGDEPTCLVRRVSSETRITFFSGFTPASSLFKRCIRRNGDKLPGSATRG
jgi:hypothetical protein